MSIVLQLVWMDKKSRVLTVEDRVIINDRRISFERLYSNDWDIHIRDVKKSDQGRYSCRINTNPVITKEVTLIVKGIVPFLTLFFF